MKKITLLLSSFLLCIAAATSSAQQSEAQDQYKLITDMAAKIKEKSNLPKDSGKGVIWQDVYAEKNKLVFDYVMNVNSDKANLDKFDALVEDAANKMMCNNEQINIKNFQDIDATLVMIYKFNDKTVTIEKSVKDCPYPKR